MTQPTLSNKKHWFNCCSYFLVIFFDKFRSLTGVAKEIETIHEKLKLESSFIELKSICYRYRTENRKLEPSKYGRAHRKRSFVSRLVQLDCLETFANCLNLVEWLREKVPSLVQFNELVNLVSTYNESLPNIDLKEFANSLKDAGAAYAPLIYDLQKGATFFEFMRNCETVFSQKR